MYLFPFDSIYYSQPSRLYNALLNQVSATLVPSTPASADRDLVIETTNDFVGNWIVELPKFERPAAFPGYTVSSTVTKQRFSMTAKQYLPVLAPIADQTMPTSQDTLTVPLSAIDADVGDIVNLFAKAGYEGYVLD